MYLDGVGLASRRASKLQICLSSNWPNISYCGRTWRRQVWGNPVRLKWKIDWVVTTCKREYVDCRVTEVIQCCPHTAILRALYRSVYVIRHSQWRTGLFYWSRVLFIARLSSACHLSVRNVRASYSGGSNFRQYFYGIRYLGHPLTSTDNFTEIVPGEPLRRGS